MKAEYNGINRYSGRPFKGWYVDRPQSDGEYQIVRVKYRSRISYEGQTEFWIEEFEFRKNSVTHLYGCKQL